MLTERLDVTASKKIAAETATLSENPDAPLTVVSTADGAKILNNLDNLTNNLDIFIHLKRGQVQFEEFYKCFFSNEKRLNYFQFGENWKVLERIFPLFLFCISEIKRTFAARKKIENLEFRYGCSSVVKQGCIFLLKWGDSQVGTGTI